jgi:SWI/SNF-related matrix-associated actin-dependent regulator 1 of chromatin subfamily A
VKTILKPFILRRLKEEVAKELIAKKQEKRVEAMTETQARLYKETLEEAREERRRRRDDLDLEKANKRPAEISHVSGALLTVSAVLPLASIPKKTKQLFVRLRKIANHPLLVRASYSEADMERIAHVCHKSGVFGFEASLDRVKAHLTEESYSDFDLHALCGDVATRGQLADLRLPERAFTDSGKTKYLLRLLHELKAKGSRPLIFSQWKIVLDVLEVALKAEGFPFVRLDGATATEERQKICDAYNAKDSSAFAFLLSTRAGGQGLNLTSADTVIIHDCDFNPQIDRQAEDRCHRLGQSKPVTVIRLVAKDTVDERIVAVAEKKLDLDAAILSDAKAVAAEENRAMHEIMEELLG